MRLAEGLAALGTVAAGGDEAAAVCTDAVAGLTASGVVNAALRQALSPARHPCGGLRVHIEGEPCVLAPLLQIVAQVQILGQRLA